MMSYERYRRGGSRDDGQRDDGYAAYGWRNPARGDRHGPNPEHRERRGDDGRPSIYGDADSDFNVKWADRARDANYQAWRADQIAALDRDYDDYRREHRAKFEQEFAMWRAERQSRRDQMAKAVEHMDVVGSDGIRVGTVDRVWDDRLLLTRHGSDAGQLRRLVPCSWIGSVESTVTLLRSADEIERHWQEEESSGALFGGGHHDDRDDDRASRTQTRSKAFSRTC